MLSDFDSTGSCFAARGPRKNVFKIWNVTEKSLTFEHSNKDNYSVVAVGQSSKPAEGSKKSRASSTVVVFGGKCGEVQVWDAAMEKQCSFTPFQDSVRQVVVHPSRQSVFVISEKHGDIVEHSLVDGSLVSSFKADKSQISAICLSPDGTRLVTASAKLKAWSLEESPPRAVAKFVAPLNAVSEMHVSPDGNFLAACDNSTSMLVYALKDSAAGKMSAHCVVTSHERIVSAKFAPATEGKPLTVYCLTSEGNIFVYGITAATPSLLGSVFCSENKVTRTSKDAIIQFVPLSHSSVRIARGVRASPEFQLLDLRNTKGAAFGLQDVTLGGQEAEAEKKVAERAPRTKLMRPRDGAARPVAVAEMQIDDAMEVDNDADDAEVDLERRLLEATKISAPECEVPRDEQILLEHCKNAANGDESAMTLLLAVEKNIVKKCMKSLSGMTALKLLTKMLDRFAQQPFPDKFMPWFDSAVASHADALSTDVNFLSCVERSLSILEESVEARGILLKLQGTVELLTYQSASVGAKLIADDQLVNDDTGDEESEESDDGDFDFDDAQ